MTYNRRYQPANKCKSEGCDNYKKMSCGGYCEDHKEKDPAYDRKEAKKVAKKTEAKVKLLPVGIPDNKLVQNSAATDFQLLQNWFTRGMGELAKNPHCAECNAFIPNVYYRAACCHILPKRKEFGFPSIAALDLNRMHLGAGCGCHNLFDNTWEQASQMKVWKTIVIPAFIEMYPFIHPSEHKNIPDLLRQYIP